MQQQLQRLADEPNEGPFSALTRRDLHSFDRQSSTSLRFRHQEFDSLGDAMEGFISTRAKRERKRKTNPIMIQDLQISLHFNSQW
jgi:hypothetical protein